MKVLTVWQPWASLLAVGAKPYEFRGRMPPAGYVGKRIGVNAGARKIVRREIEQLLGILNSRHAWRTCLVPELAVPLLERALVEPEILPLGAIVCTGVLGEARSGAEIAREFGMGPVNDSERHEHSNFGWPLTDIEAVIPPEPHRGLQGWSEWGGR